MKQSLPIPTLLVALLIFSCSSNKQETTAAAPDSTEATLPEHVKVVSDTITSYVDLKAIEVIGDSDSIKLSFGPEGKLIMRKKILGPMSEQAVGRGFAGVDELDAMPKGYEPTTMPFSYSGTPFRDLLGNQYYLKYQLINDQPTFYEIQEAGDIQAVGGEWKLITEIDGKHYFVFDGPYPPPRLLVKPAERQLMIFDVDTITYNIGQISFTEYGKRGTLYCTTSDSIKRPTVTVSFYNLTDEYNQYLWTEWSNIFKEGEKADFVRPKDYGRFKKR